MSNGSVDVAFKQRGFFCIAERRGNVLHVCGLKSINSDRGRVLHVNFNDNCIFMANRDGNSCILHSCCL